MVGPVADDSPKVLKYRRAEFSTRLPLHYRYSPTHWWVEPTGDRQYRAGISKFSTRMLGEMVEFGFEIAPESEIQPGTIIGWLEGFKAISDIYSVAMGRFLARNEGLDNDASLINRDPYRRGWIYHFEGDLDGNFLDVNDYAALLDKTIDKILEQQKTDEIN